MAASSKRTRVAIGLLCIAALIGATAWLGRPETLDPDEAYRLAEAQRDSVLPTPEKYANLGRLHTSVDQAGLDAGYEPAYLEGREADLLGIVVVPTEESGVTGSDQMGIVEFYGDVNFLQLPHASPEDAQEGARSLAGVGNVEPLTVDGHEAYLYMNSASGGGLSQLSWAKGSVFYHIRADQREPRELLIDAANSVVYP